MNLQLQGKRALVTGAGTGIGQAVAIALAREGVRVVLHARSEEDAVTTRDTIHDASGEAVITTGDLTIDADALKLANRSSSAFGGIDILVNNACSYFGEAWTETAPDRWTALYDNNVTSMVRVTRLLAPAMAERGWGRVINMASTIGLMPDVNMAAYAATKAAIHNLTVALSRDLGRKGVTVNAISPGLTASSSILSMLQAMVNQQGWPADPVALERKAVQEWAPNPVGRMGSVEEVADLVAFVASPLAGYINGTNVRVDGGLDPTIS